MSASNPAAKLHVFSADEAWVLRHLFVARQRDASAGPLAQEGLRPAGQLMQGLIERRVAGETSPAQEKETVAALKRELTWFPEPTQHDALVIPPDIDPVADRPVGLSGAVLAVALDRVADIAARGDTKRSDRQRELHLPVGLDRKLFTVTDYIQLRVRQLTKPHGRLIAHNLRVAEKECSRLAGSPVPGRRQLSQMVSGGPTPPAGKPAETPTHAAAR